ncbi:MAG: 1-(5-phosphoribosyl)-5-[(5-phosphoribosylamino)methylideneamino]imidazole-4-carboxamide isomerase [Candidatus Omnitrophica bacterium]|nr:1-(5-phosphoribosyl)-5-[(5-phosphoribosylamino)methylideneamino]imidazole-4-carboxamide isomerase [Candidatus Omnitrophota bacterium]
MILIPAIDLIDGKVVRLFQGRFDNIKEYDTDPVSMAKNLVSQGAQWLHVIDLDGAKTGVMNNIEVIAKIVKAIDIPVQVGGGVRSEAAIKKLLDVGVTRVILGSKAIPSGDTQNDTFGTMMVVSSELLEYGEDKIAVSIDCLNGFVTQHGWTETSHRKGIDLAKYLVTVGIKTIIYTDISKDGAMQGPNYEEILSVLNEVPANIIASGGISSLDDVKKLRDLKSNTSKTLWGAITGKAIYEGKLDFKKALEICN